MCDSEEHAVVLFLFPSFLGCSKVRALVLAFRDKFDLPISFLLLLFLQLKESIECEKSDGLARLG